MKKFFNFSIVFLCLNFGLVMLSCSSGKLTEEKAKRTVEKFLEQYHNPWNIRNNYKLNQFYLIKTDENNMEGKAKIFFQQKVNYPNNTQGERHAEADAEFAFQKLADGNWVLENWSVSNFDEENHIHLKVE